MSTPLRLCIHGAQGRMGQALIRCAAEDPELEVTATVDADDNFPAALAGCDAVIDFSATHITGQVAKACAEAGKVLVIGTTGHELAEREQINKAAAKIPLVFSPNYRVGVNTLFWLTRKAAEILGPDFDLEVVEMHHRLKKDSPSGTARQLAEILAEVRQLDYAESARHGRAGIVGERTSNEIGVHAIRGGDVVGDHTVIYASLAVYLSRRAVCAVAAG